MKKEKCPIPFKVLSIDVLWNIQSCSKLFWVNNYSIWNVDKNSFLNEWNNNKIINKLRQKIINWEEIEDLCKGCKYKNNFIKNYPNISLDSEKKVELLEIRFSNLCNFSCKMCYSSASSNLYNRDLKKYWKENSYKYEWEKLINNNIFWDDINKILDGLKTIYIWWWEPLINPTHFIFLDKIINSGFSKNIELIYHSNLSIIPWITWKVDSSILLWHSNITDFWNNFKSVKVFWSCDWYWEIYEKIRIWWNWKTFEKNSLLLNKLWLLWWISVTIQNDNIYNIPLIEKWAEKNNINIDYKFINFPEELNIKNIDNKVKIISFFEKLYEKKQSNIYIEILNYLK